MKNRFLSTTLIILTISSIPVSFYISTVIGESDFFGLAGIIKYAWISFLFIPIGIGSFILGLFQKKQGNPYRANQIVALICVPILLMIGLFSFFPAATWYDDREVEKIESQTDFDLPDEIKVASIENYGYIETYVKILNETEKQTFSKSIEQNEKWTNSLDEAIGTLVPYDVRIKIKNFDYFLFYNETMDEYNACPNYKIESNCFLVCYDVSDNKIVILSDWKIYK